MSDPLVTVMIATRDRISELVKTLCAIREHDWPSLEIIVADDASNDGTSTTVRRDFPEVRLIRLDENVGSVAARNRIVGEAKGRYVIGLDDDSRFVEPDAIRRVVRRMEAEPDLGIVSFQPIGPEHPERMTESGRLRGEWHTSSFAACGVAIRRDVLQQVGPFPEFFFHMYEEPDLCLRVWDAGYRVLQWNEITVYHEFSPLNRNERKTHRRHVRNEACSVWMRYPWPLVIPATAYRLIRQAFYAHRRGWLRHEPSVWFETFRYLPTALRHRRPVSVEAVKVCIAVNQIKTADTRQVGRFRQLTWPEVLTTAHRGIA